MTKDEALQYMWEAADGLMEMSLAKEICAVFNYQGRIPFKNVEQLRAEGIFLEKGAPDVNPGETRLYTAVLPEGVLVCDLAEVMSGYPKPIIQAKFSMRENCLWRTEQALTKGFGWDPYGRKFIV